MWQRDSDAVRSHYGKLGGSVGELRSGSPSCQSVEIWWIRWEAPDLAAPASFPAAIPPKTRIRPQSSSNGQRQDKHFAERKYKIVRQKWRVQILRRSISPSFPVQRRQRRRTAMPLYIMQLELCSAFASRPISLLSSRLLFRFHSSFEKIKLKKPETVSFFFMLLLDCVPPNSSIRPTGSARRRRRARRRRA